MMPSMVDGGCGDDYDVDLTNNYDDDIHDLFLMVEVIGLEVSSLLLVALLPNFSNAHGFVL